MSAHGTYWRYCAGCRCRACRGANSLRKRMARLGITGQCAATFGVRVGARWAAVAAKFVGARGGA